MTTQVAFIGLGNMGRPMARRLVDAGVRLNGFDRAAPAVEAARALGVEVADSLEEAAQGADVLLLMVPSSDVVEAVLADPAVQSAVRGGVTVLDMSSSDPMRTRALAVRLSELGATLIDAPVSGGVAGAVRGTLTIMAGGTDEDIDRVEPLLKTMGSVRRTGSVGSGHAVKALNNLLSATHMLVSSEAVRAAIAFGLDPRVVLDVINSSSGRSFSTEYKWPTFVLPESFDSGFALRLLVKDAAIAVDLARSLGLPSSLGEAALALWTEAAGLLPEDADHTEIARVAGELAPTEGGRA